MTSLTPSARSMNPSLGWSKNRPVLGWPAGLPDRLTQSRVLVAPRLPADKSSVNDQLSPKRIFSRPRAKTLRIVHDLPAAPGGAGSGGRRASFQQGPHQSQK